MRRAVAPYTVLVFCALAVFLLPAYAAAQASGTFTGQVTDQAKAVMPGVILTITNRGTGIERTTITNTEGVYSAPGLEAGTYRVQASVDGFSSALRENVNLAANSTLTLDFTLSVAALSETVTVSGTTPLIEVSQSHVKGEIGATEVVSLPMITRNLNNMISLLPGAKPATAFHQTKKNAGAVSFGGSAGRNVIATLDGADNRDNVIGGTLMNVTLESLEQFELATHQFSAADGRTSGAALALVTKSGTNAFQGSAFSFNRFKALIAKDYFASRDNIPKPDFNRYQYGGSLGGPLVKNRAFFFGAVEGVNETTSIVVPDGLFKEISLLEPFGAKPVHVIPQSFRDTLYTGKVNVQISAAQSVAVRYSGQNNARTNSALSQRNDLSAPLTEPNDYWNAVVQHSWILSPRVLNQFVLTASHFSCLSDFYTPSGQLYLANFPNAPLPSIESQLVFPSVQIGMVTGTFRCGQDLQPQIRDDVSLQVGRHALKLGGAYNRYAKAGGEAGGVNWGNLTFFDDPSVIASNANGKYPQGFQTPGIVRQWVQSNPVVADFYIPGFQQVMAWVQDDWRIQPKLTLNLGLRYDLDINLYGQREYQMNPTAEVLRAVGSPYGQFPQTPTRDFSPRVGFAYDLSGNGRRVLRGGYGLYFDQYGLTGNVSSLLQNDRPLSATVALVNTAIGVGQLSTYRYGIDPPPPPPVAVDSLPRGATGQWTDPNLTDPRTHQYHLGYAHELAASTVLSVDYTRVDGRHEFKTLEINPIVNGQRVLAPAMQAVYGVPNRLNSVLVTASVSKSRYDELAVQLKGRLPRVTFQMSYTLSGAYAYGGTNNGAGGPAGGITNGQAQDAFDLYAPGEWGPTPADERHRVVAFGAFQLPYQIEVSPIFQAATARPYTLTAGRDLNADGTNNDRYVDPVSGQQVAVNSERGDPFVLMDLRVTKFVNLGGARKIGLFAEFFNLFNTANFGQSYIGNALSTSFKQPNGFMPSLGYPFQVQLGTRVSF